MLSVDFDKLKKKIWTTGSGTDQCPVGLSLVVHEILIPKTHV